MTEARGNVLIQLFCCVGINIILQRITFFTKTRNKGFPYIAKLNKYVCMIKVRQNNKVVFKTGFYLSGKLKSQT